MIGMNIQTREKNAHLERTLTETHHRVKNHFQMIAALLEIQVDGRTQTLPAAGVARLKIQISAMAALHDILIHCVQQAATDESVQLKELIGRVTQEMARFCENDPFEVQAESILVSTKQAGVLALIVQELLGNALKHGAHCVRVTLSEWSGIARLAVTDDGPGLPDDFTAKRASRTGLVLVEQMVRWDLCGKIRFENGAERGACVELEFPLVKMG